MSVNIKKILGMLWIIISIFFILNLDICKKQEQTKSDQLLQQLIDQNAGGTVSLPRNKEYKINDTLIIPSNTSIIGNGSKIFNDTKNITLLKVGENVKIYNLEIEGSGSSKYNDESKAIEIMGSNSSDYTSIVYLENCYIHDISGYGIYLKYAKNVSIKNSRISRIGYAGIHGMSVKNVIVDNVEINKVGPGKSSSISGEKIAYGITFTQSTTFKGVSANPRSENCIVINSTISDIAWEALDTHGGISISFINNIISNSKFGISVVPVSVKNDNGITMKTLAPQFCYISGNKLYGTGQGSAIVVQGAYNSDPQTGKVNLAKPTEYVKNSIVSNNKSVGFGQKGNDARGAIYIRETLNLIVKGNRVEESYMNGITLHYSNINFSITDNKIKNIRVSKQNIPIGISVKGSYNKGIINNNKISNFDSKNNKLIKKLFIDVKTENKIKYFN
ncbi:hypothetical protein QNH16_17515 [Peribacillus frigoritolerans]|uniref:right-handed parallel beta-helix repeat-containing protein n=1 Tax=Peribacillus frigoritolerans TaxID=450367 RepID=UPI0024C07FC0|nr:right-handed parallel beta-helix repeat-containing protein [Peribacillus frigoritolerans]WHY12580.1 hypothetical protein QNH16_17515 [Peribacillus frigoritolerans]